MNTALGAARKPKTADVIGQGRTDDKQRLKAFKHGFEMFKIEPLFQTYHAWHPGGSWHGHCGSY